jgi:hypothetical protein
LRWAKNAGLLAYSITLQLNVCFDEENQKLDEIKKTAPPTYANDAVQVVNTCV